MIGMLWPGICYATGYHLHQAITCMPENRCQHVCCCQAPCCSWVPRVFRASKFAFVDTLVAIVSDVKIFLAFLFLTLLVSAHPRQPAGRLGFNSGFSVPCSAGARLPSVRLRCLKLVLTFLLVPY